MKTLCAFAACSIVTASVLSTSGAAFRLEPAWDIAPGERAYVTGTSAGNTATSDNLQRGVAYNPTTGNLLLVNRAGGLSVQKVRASDGADRGTLNLGSITTSSGGTFAINMIGVANDGAIYVGNLTTGTAPATGTPTNFKLYKWNDESSAPTLVYDGNPAGASNSRFGDNLDVRGAGANTQVMLGSRAGTFVSLLSATDSSASAFTASVITSTATGSSASNGPFGLGVAFGGANDFWGDSATPVPLRKVSLIDGSVLANIDPSLVPTTLTGLDVDGNLLAGINLIAGTDELRLYDISNPNSPVLLDTELFPANNPNSNGVGSVDFGAGMLFALDTNNGLMAFTVVPEPSTYASIFGGILLVGAMIRRRFKA